MKKFSKILSLLLVFLMGLVVSCQKEELLQDSVVETGKTDATNTTTQAPQPPMPAPIISSVTSNGYGLSGTGSYATYWRSDYGATNPSSHCATLTINGSNFGTSGSVALWKLVGSTYSATSSYTVHIMSWSNTQITVKVSGNLSSEPVPNGQIRVTSGGLVGTYTTNVRIVPNIYTRQYGQCTWWASKRRGSSGLSIQPAGQSYSATTGSIGANYIPQFGDIWIWGTSHQGFVESVSSSTQNFSTYSVITYTINTSEYNWNWTEQLSTYTNTVRIRVQGGVRSWHDTTRFRSNNPAMPSSYYR